MIQQFRRQLLMSAVAIATVSAAAPVCAQTAPAALQDAGQTADTEAPATDIVVTGSRIGRPDLAQASPIKIIGEAEIERRQQTSVEQFLRDLPGNAPGIGQQVNNGQGGIATTNLLGLGSNRNLVLLNGRRVVPSNLGNVVDTNIIPIGLLSKAEVFTGGATVAYGADAIAGVVNFSTKQDFSGVDVSANYGFTERGDGQSYRLDFTTGVNTADGKGNVVFGLSYANVQPVLQGNRDIGLVSRASTCTAAIVAAGTCAAQTVGTEQGSGTAVPATLFFPLPAGVGAARFDPAAGNIDTTGASNFNFNPLNLFQSPLDRWSIYGAGHYEIVPNVNFYSEAFFSRTRVVSNLAPTGTFTNQFQLPLNNQFLTATQRTQLCAFAGIANCTAAVAAGQEITAIVARRFVEAGPRVTEFSNNVFQITTGLRGKLTNTLNWDFFVQYGEAARRNTNTGTALAERVQQGLRNCPTGSAAGCVPINIFGAAGSLSQEALTFVGTPTSTFVNTSFASVQGLVNGDFGVSSPLAAKPIAVAVGGEYRRYSGSQFGDLPSATPGAILGSGGAFSPISGSYFSREGFAELIVPLVAERPFFHDLTLETGARYASYSNSGGNWTYKFGGSWAPVEDIRIRGVWSRAVRAPNIGELFAPVATGLNNLATDPCQLALPTGNATTTALCSAQLAAVGVAASRLGSIPAPIAGQINVTTGGNPNLDPEVATTYTVGIVLQPRSVAFLRGLTATADFYDVVVTGAISSPTVSDIVNGCFGQSNPNDTRCTAIRRNPLTGGLSGDPATTQGAILQSSNLGFLNTRGFNFGADYSRSFGEIKANIGITGNYTLRSRFQATPSTFIRECVNFYSVSCDPVLPKFTFQQRTSVSVDLFDVSLLWRHISPTQFEPRTGATPTTQPAVGTVGSFGSTNPATIIGAYRRIPAFDYLDLNLSANLTSQFRIGFLITNLLDRQAPDVGNTIGSTGFNSGNTFPSTYDPIGRRFTLNGRLKF